MDLLTKSIGFMCPHDSEPPHWVKEHPDCNFKDKGRKVSNQIKQEVLHLNKSIAFSNLKVVKCNWWVQTEYLPPRNISNEHPVSFLVFISEHKVGRTIQPFWMTISSNYSTMIFSIWSYYNDVIAIGGKEGVKDIE